MTVNTIESLLQLIALTLPASAIYMQVLVNIHTRQYDNNNSQVRVHYQREFTLCRASILALLISAAILIILLTTYQFNIPYWKMDRGELEFLRGILMILGELALLGGFGLLGASIVDTAGERIRDLI